MIVIGLGTRGAMRIGFQRAHFMFMCANCVTAPMAEPCSHEGCKMRCASTSRGPGKRAYVAYIHVCMCGMRLLHRFICILSRVSGGKRIYMRTKTTSHCLPRDGVKHITIYVCVCQSKLCIGVMVSCVCVCI